ncbi:MAG: DUF4340 domain-containing protein [Bacteroides sp.]|nr:DUF4340 domain-containing protein [Bacteroides sp.]
MSKSKKKSTGGLSPAEPKENTVPAQEELSNQAETAVSNDAADEVLADISAVEAFADKVQTDNTSKDKPKGKKKLGKSAKTIIISLVAVIVLVGIFIGVQFLPDADSDDTSSIEETEEYVLVDHVPADVSTIEVENESGSYTITSYTPTVTTTDSDGTTSESTEATEYTLVGYEDMELLSGSPDALATDVSAITSTKIVNDGSDTSEFGFDEPRATITTTFTDDTSYTVYLGSDAPSDLGAYIMIEGDSNVYLVDSDAVDSYTTSAMDLIDTSINDSAATEDDGVFTSLVFGGRHFDGQEVVLEYSEYEAFSAGYVITSPDNTIANEETVTYMVNAVRGLTGTSVVYIGADDEVLAEYGLDDPYVTVEAEYPDLTVSYRASEPDDEGTVYLESDGIIYTISQDSIPWVTTTYEEMLPSSVMDPNSSGVSKITVTTEDGEYVLDVEHETTVTTTYDSDSDTDVETETTTTTVTYDGDEVDIDNFNIFFQNLTSAERNESTDVDESADTVLTIEYEFTDGTTGTAVFYEAVNRKHPVLINGTITGYVYTDYVQKVTEDIVNLVNGESVTSIY